MHKSRRTFNLDVIRRIDRTVKYLLRILLKVRLGGRAIQRRQIDSNEFVSTAVHFGYAMSLNANSFRRWPARIVDTTASISSASLYAKFELWPVGFKGRRFLCLNFPEFKDAI